MKAIEQMDLNELLDMYIEKKYGIANGTNLLPHEVWQSFRKLEGAIKNITSYLPVTEIPF